MRSALGRLRWHWSLNRTRHIHTGSVALHHAVVRLLLWCHTAPALYRIWCEWTLTQLSIARGFPFAISNRSQRLSSVWIVGQEAYPIPMPFVGELMSVSLEWGGEASYFVLDESSVYLLAHCWWSASLTSAHTGRLFHDEQRTSANLCIQWQLGLGWMTRVSSDMMMTACMLVGEDHPPSAADYGDCSQQHCGVWCRSASYSSLTTYTCCVWWDYTGKTCTLYVCTHASLFKWTTKGDMLLPIPIVGLRNEKLNSSITDNCFWWWWFYLYGSQLAGLVYKLCSSVQKSRNKNTTIQKYIRLQHQQLIRGLNIMVQGVWYKRM